MKIKLIELKEKLIKSYLFEDFEQRRQWTRKDVHTKVQDLLDKATKLRKIANSEKKERKIKMYSRLSDELIDLAEKIRDTYDITKDPNVIYKVYNDYYKEKGSSGFDPQRV